MARPLASGKKTVNLASGPRPVGSRIRRAPPPPPPKQRSAAEVREREAWVIGTGIVAIALALAVVTFSVMRWSGWSPNQHQVVFHDRA